MLKPVLSFLLLISLSVAAGNAIPSPRFPTAPQVTDNRNLMWCNARSGQTMYYSAWFRYSPSRADEHRAKFQKDTQANYNLKTLDTPTCYSFPDTPAASDAYESNIKTQKKAGFKIITTGWMPQ
jgi:hypothetical protein